MLYNPKSRRAFLRGSSGYLLSIPVLNSLLDKTWAQTATPNVNFVAYITKWGQHYDNFWPTVQANTSAGNGTYYTNLTSVSGNLSPIFDARFNGYKGDLTFIKGLDGLTRAGHNSGLPLTGSRASGQGPTTNSVMKSSIDAIMENSRGVYAGNPKARAIRIGQTVSAYPGTWSRYNGNVRGYQTSISTAYVQSLFSGVNFGTTPQPNPSPTGPSAEDMAKSLAIDGALPEFNRARNSTRISAEDKLVLENFADILSDAQRELTSAAPVVTGGSGKCTQPQTTGTLFEAGTSIIASALACGVTKVASLVNLQFAPAVHGDTHSNNRQVLLSANIPLSGVYLSLLNKMKALNVLDQSMVLWCNELGSGSGHYPYGLPVVVAGKAGGRIRSGYLIDCERRPKVRPQAEGHPIGKPYNYFLMDLMRVMGVAQNEYEINGSGQGYGEWSPPGNYGSIPTKNGSIPYFVA